AFAFYWNFGVRFGSQLNTGDEEVQQDEEDASRIGVEDEIGCIGDYDDNDDEDYCDYNFLGVLLNESLDQDLRFNFDDEEEDAEEDSVNSLCFN
ncbi:MAG: hypothetical protein EZS28_037210, partial [Streblomastix strix]